MMRSLALAVAYLVAAHAATFPTFSDLNDYLLIGTGSNENAKAVNVQNGDLGADIVVLSTEINDNVDFDLDDVFLHNAGKCWVDVDNKHSAQTSNVGPDFLPGAAIVGEDVTWTGDVALTSGNAMFDMSNVELYGQVGVVAEDNGVVSSVSNSLFFGNGKGNGFDQDDGVDLVGNAVSELQNLTTLRTDIKELAKWVEDLPPDKTLKPGDGLPSSQGCEDVDVWELNVDEIDANGNLDADGKPDGIAVIDIDVGDNDFKITNCNWVIESEEGKTFAVIRVVGGSNLVLNQGTIMIGDGTHDNAVCSGDNSGTKPTTPTTELLAMLTKTRKTKKSGGGYKSGEETGSGDTVFNFNDVVINGVAIYDLIHFSQDATNEPYYDDGKTETLVSNGQGCSQFISPKINFNNVRFDRCAYGGNDSPSLEKLGGGNGDPHIKRWNRKSFDFHGECDLVLVHSDHVNGDKVLDLHMRTVIREWWSQIESASLKVGNTVFQVDADKLYLNGNELSEADLPMKTEDFVITAEATTTAKGIHQREDVILKTYVAVLNNKSRVYFKILGDFINVEVQGSEKDFAHATGLMGDFHLGKPYNRKGERLYDLEEFSFEWQVNHDVDPNLFIETKGPQLPAEKCRMPDITKTSRRKLRGSDPILMKAAEEACADKGEEFHACVDDVIATRNVAMALIH